MTVPPAVTVLMSAMNAAPYIREAVDSVLSQTFTDFEFIVFDDASTDSTAAILGTYSDERLILIKNTQNQGLTLNLIKGMDMARGEFVVRIDADDVCMPRRIERQVEFMRGNPEIGLSCCSVAFFGDGRSDVIVHQPEDHDRIKCTLFFGYCMLHPSVILRKSKFVDSGLNYDPHFTCSQDHDLWVRSARKMRLGGLSEVLVKMREHGNKIGVTRKNVQTTLSNEIRARQMAELGVDGSAAEMEVFNRAAVSEPARDENDLRNFESLLFKIFEANRTKGIFNQQLLETMGASHFRGLCRDALVRGNRFGRYYWRSGIAQLDHCTMREWLGLVYRSCLR